MIIDVVRILTALSIVVTLALPEQRADARGFTRAARTTVTSAKPVAPASRPLSAGRPKLGLLGGALEPELAEPAKPRSVAAIKRARPDSAAVATRPRGRLFDFYFREHAFERDGTLYRALGVPLFSKYWINGGSFWSKRSSWSPFRADQKSEGQTAQLETYVAYTKVLETIHVVGAGVFIGISLVAAASGTWAVAANLLLANVVANALPIASQRLNRHRADRLLRVAEAREARAAVGARTAPASAD